MSFISSMSSTMPCASVSSSGIISAANRMRVSGVRKSWETPAIRRLRSFSSSRMPFDIWLNARVTAITSLAPFSCSCSGNSPLPTLRADSSSAFNGRFNQFANSIPPKTLDTPISSKYIISGENCPFCILSKGTRIQKSGAFGGFTQIKNSLP